MKKLFLPLILLASVATVAYGEEQNSTSESIPTEVLFSNKKTKLVNALQLLQDPAFATDQEGITNLAQEMSAICDEVDPESEDGRDCVVLMTALRESLARVQKQEDDEFIATTATDVD